MASSIWSGTEVQIKVSEVSRLRRIQNRCTSHCCAPPKIYIYIRSLIFTDISHDTFGGTSSILAVREKKMKMALPQILPKFVFFFHRYVCQQFHTLWQGHNYPTFELSHVLFWKGCSVLLSVCHFIFIYVMIRAQKCHERHKKFMKLNLIC